MHNFKPADNFLGLWRVYQRIFAYFLSKKVPDRP